MCTAHGAPRDRYNQWKTNEITTLLFGLITDESLCAAHNKCVHTAKVFGPMSSPDRRGYGGGGKKKYATKFEEVKT